jgi:hypothetical protein
MTPEQLSKIIAAFPNDSKRHHHALIRQLAQQCLQSGFEATMLKAHVDGLRAELAKKPVPFKADCDAA